METKKSKSSWFWKIDKEDLKNQVENYDKLKITQSYRGVSVLIVVVLLGLSLLLGFFGVYANIEETLYGLIIYVPILIFVYRGHRWAIIALMILWTFEKWYQLIEVGSIMPLIWWIIIIPYFYKALKIENERRKLSTNQNTSSDKRFCSHCGSAIDIDANFCRHCGEKNDVAVETRDTSKFCPFCKTKIGIDYEECPNCQRLLVEKISSNNQLIHEYQKPYYYVWSDLFRKIRNFFIERINYPKFKIYSTILLGTIFVVWIFSGDEYSYNSSSTKAPLPPPIKQISNDSVELASFSPAVSLSNGTILKKNSAYLQGDGELQIKNGTDLDAVAKLICDGTSVSTVYIKANSTYTMRNISNGIYWLAFAQGLDWDSTIQKFRRNTQYSVFEEIFDFAITEDSQYYYHSIFEVTLNPVIGGTAETNDVPESQFYQY
ncbi:MAG: zinc ribbon domain-containing protein [Candidatus Andersenbacteria bacterium]|nr:zinc ribbon domain-containing protein [Candidatus Andersenbacteria bacterium]